jgi:beta-1,2-mannobiose phosphorylase / 1,2-beta-oligomannan phosphorylase
MSRLLAIMFGVTVFSAPVIAGDHSADTAGGWVKHPDHPVLGGQYGTCFEIAVLRENDVYRMWVSWRPKRSVALVESKDGLSWTAPEIVLPPTGIAWADDVNRPTVLRRPDGYHM